MLNALCSQWRPFYYEMVVGRDSRELDTNNMPCMLTAYGRATDLACLEKLIAAKAATALVLQYLGSVKSTVLPYFWQVSGEYSVSVSKQFQQRI